MQRPFALWPLIFCLLFLALGGLYGGIAMLTDPTGSSHQLTEVLPLLPESDYILPGVFLLVMIVLVQLLLIYGLLIGFEWAIQYVTALDGFLIMLLALLPEVRKFYAGM